MTDDLLDRLRAADPVADDPALLFAPADGARVTSFRRRRGAARAARVAVPGTALATAAVIAALVPAGGDGGLAVADVVARAVAAAELPADRIVVVRTAVEASWDGGGLTEARTVWVRLGDDGEPVAVRSLLTAATGENVRAGAEEASYVGADGKRVLERRDPDTGAVERVEGQIVPSEVFRAERLLDRARSGDAEVRLAGETTFAGRRALRLSVPELGLPERIRERRELLVDAETYRPLATTVHTEGIAQDGKPFTYDLTERVVDRRVLPDDAEHRAQLRLDGPKG